MFTSTLFWIVCFFIFIFMIVVNEEVMILFSFSFLVFYSLYFSFKLIIFSFQNFFALPKWKRFFNTKMNEISTKIEMVLHGNERQKRNRRINPCEIDLLDRILSSDPPQRPTAADAMLHPYFCTPLYPMLPSEYHLLLPLFFSFLGDSFMSILG